MSGLVGVGIDLVDVERFRQSLRRTPSLAGRLFTESEQAYAARRPDPAERLAGRFAAKEAVMKAMGVGLGAFAFRDVEVVAADSGAPVLQLHGGARGVADRLGVQRWHLSITHAGGMAQAVAIAE